MYIFLYYVFSMSCGTICTNSIFFSLRDGLVATCDNVSVNDFTVNWFVMSLSGVFIYIPSNGQYLKKSFISIIDCSTAFSLFSVSIPRKKNNIKYNLMIGACRLLYVICLQKQKCSLIKPCTNMTPTSQ